MPYLFHPTVFETERKIIARRRNAIKQTPAEPSGPEATIGLALSGGGIRSATFSLGVIQWLARQDLLKKVDYLSTVSGGGYTGSYLMSHFLPEDVRQRKGDADPSAFEKSCQEAYQSLGEAATPQPQAEACAGVRSTLVRGVSSRQKKAEAWSARKAFEWLRNNGRYLAPRGTGDLVYVIAMQIRNWAAVQYVIGIMILFLLVSFSTLRAWLIAKCALWRQIEVLFLPHPGATIYWSPGWLLVGLFGLLFVLPPALAYWLAHSKIEEKRDLSWLPLWHEGAIIFLLLLGLTFAYGVLALSEQGDAPMVRWSELPSTFWVATGYVALSLCAIGTFLAGLDLEARGRKPFVRHVILVLTTVDLILWALWPGVGGVLRAALVVGAIAAAIGLALTFRQRGARVDVKTLRTRFTRWLRVTFMLFLGSAGLALLGTIGQTVYAYVRLEPGAGRIVGLTSTVGAIVAGARLLFKWLGSGTARTGRKLPLGALAGAAGVLLLVLIGGAWATLVQAALWKGGPPAAIPTAARSDPCQACEAGERIWIHAAEVDPSPWRRGTEAPVTLDPNGQSELQQRPVAIAPGWMTLLFAGVGFLFFTTGMFLNFINMSSLHQFYAARLARAYLGATNRDRFQAGSVVPVTSPMPTDSIPLASYYHQHLAAPVHLINVTLNQTRPSEGQLVQRDRKGMSMAVGPGYSVVNSAVFRRQEETGNLVPVNDEAAALAGVHTGKMFQAEELDVGDWCAISGAAFSTGLGMRTSLGLSLLAGLANTRLGYWWNFNTDARDPWWNLPPAYRYLWSELMADFRGPWRPFWFLTDGGHFDNTAVYELVRRRVGIIVLCDNGCDPQFDFGDLGNLARKIRTDFDAELQPLVPPPATGPFGTRAQFADPTQRLGKCALLFEITYPPPGPNEPPPRPSRLIVLKPNRLADMPLDVAEYAAANEAFPHQTTVDQFFDDAQWESYRKLGEVIAGRVLTPEALRFDGWPRAVQP
jgi:Patatin-like phospholipase